MKNEFVWGVSSSAFQIEGATSEGGRGLSTWDVYTRTPGKILNGRHRRHRLRPLSPLPGGRQAHGGARRHRLPFLNRVAADRSGRRRSANPAGIAFYSDLIDTLLEYGIQPYPTLYHWDLPVINQFVADGWLSRQTAEAFARYAGICFEAFGDRVRHWITLNESWCSAVIGYGLGAFPPGRRDSEQPYLAAHNLLLAHAMAARTFREGGFDGRIGIANNCDWREPLTGAEADRRAAERALQFFYGWFTDPLVFGEYPEMMREKLGGRLPEFTSDERKFVAGSVDFLGLNHYTTLYASAEPPAVGCDIGPNGNGGMIADQDVFLSVDPAWVQTDMVWSIVPWGLRKMLNWVGERYPGIPVYVTENGCSCPEPDVESALNDTMRQEYLKAYTASCLAARDEDGVDVRGYFCWTLLDNFEWTSGYARHFGLVRCTPSDLTRIRKGASAPTATSSPPTDSARNKTGAGIDSGAVSVSGEYVLFLTGVEDLLRGGAEEGGILFGDSFRDELDFGGRLVEEETVPDARLQITAAVVQVGRVVVDVPLVFSGGLVFPAAPAHADGERTGFGRKRIGIFQALQRLAIILDILDRLGFAGELDCLSGRNQPDAESGRRLVIRIDELVEHFPLTHLPRLQPVVVETVGPGLLDDQLGLRGVLFHILLQVFRVGHVALGFPGKVARLLDRDEIPLLRFEFVAERVFPVIRLHRRVLFGLFDELPVLGRADSRRCWRGP